MSQKLVPIVGVTDDTTGQLVGVKPDQSAGGITVLGQMSADAIADTLEDAKVSDPASLTRVQGLVSGAEVVQAGLSADPSAAATALGETAVGRAITTAATAPAQRTALGLGTAATTAATAYATAAQGVLADNAVKITGETRLHTSSGGATYSHPTLAIDTLMPGDKVQVRVKMASGGWARSFSEIANQSGSVWAAFGGYGDGQSFVYAYIGTDYANPWLCFNSGRVGVKGVVSPTAALHLPAGVATNFGAPMKMTPGTLLTTPEASALEYDGVNLYFTPASGVRKMVTLA